MCVYIYIYIYIYIFLKREEEKARVKKRESVLIKPNKLWEISECVCVCIYIYIEKRGGESKREKEGECSNKSWKIRELVNKKRKRKKDSSS